MRTIPGYRCVRCCSQNELRTCAVHPEHTTWELGVVSAEVFFTHMTHVELCLDMRHAGQLNGQAQVFQERGSSILSKENLTIYDNSSHSIL